MTVAGPTVGMTMVIQGILASAREFMHCCKFSTRKKITVGFLAWEETGALKEQSPH